MPYAIQTFNNVSLATFDNDSIRLLATYRFGQEAHYAGELFDRATATLQSGVAVDFVPTGGVTAQSRTDTSNSAGRFLIAPYTDRDRRDYRRVACALSSTAYAGDHYWYRVANVRRRFAPILRAVGDRPEPALRRRTSADRHERSDRRRTGHVRTHRWDFCLTRSTAFRIDRRRQIQFESRTINRRRSRWESHCPCSASILRDTTFAITPHGTPDVPDGFRSLARCLQDQSLARRDS